MELAHRDKKARGHGSCLRKARYCPSALRCYSLPDLGLEQPRRRAAALRPWREGFWMDDEAPPNGGLDARGGQRRPRWGRRTPYGLRRDSRGDGWHEPADGRSDATYAALDLGTNNCRLLIARPAGDGFRVVDAFSRIIRLGEGVAASRRSSGGARARALESPQVCPDKMSS